MRTAGSLRETQVPCSGCGRLLIEVNFNREFFVHLCDHDGCPKFRQPQGSRRKYRGIPEEEDQTEPQADAG